MADSPLTERLLQLAGETLRATQAGRVTWARTGDIPPEYHALISEETALAVRRTAGRRPRPFGHGPASGLPRTTREALRGPTEDDALSTDEYELFLLSVGGRERATLSSRQFDLDDPDYGQMRELFEAAQAAGEGATEAVDRALRALQTA